MQDDIAMLELGLVDADLLNDEINNAINASQPNESLSPVFCNDDGNSDFQIIDVNMLELGVVNADALNDASQLNKSLSQVFGNEDSNNDDSKSNLNIADVPPLLNDASQLNKSRALVFCNDGNNEPLPLPKKMRGLKRKLRERMWASCEFVS